MLASGLAIVGAGIGLAMVILLWRLPGHFPPLDVLAYLRGGAAVVAGTPVYTTGVNADLAFLYGPPWAVAFAAVSFVPPPAVAFGLVGLDLLALRYICGSWRGVGLVAWCPLVPLEVAGGNINILMTAGLVAGARGAMMPAAVFGLAKLSPLVMLLGPRAGWRPFATSVILLLAITLPWLHLWPEWFAFLLRQHPPEVGGPVAVALLPRLPVALAFLALRRPWSLALAAVLATPVLWWGSFVMLLAPVRLFLDAHGNGTPGSAPDTREARRPALHLRPAIHVGTAEERARASSG